MRYLLSLIAVLFLAASLNAQVHGRNNISVQPLWGPTGNDYVECYYLPDIEAYYSVPLHKFYVFEGKRWVGYSNLPGRFSKFDLFHSYKVVINERNPWLHHNQFRDKYGMYRGRYDQEMIRESRDSRYYVIKNHPQHNQWMKDQRRAPAPRKMINENRSNVRNSVRNERNNIQQNRNNNKKIDQRSNNNRKKDERGR